jgi:hypothetical protein
MSGSKKRVRINLDLPQLAADNLNALVDATNAESRTKVIRDALALYKAFVEFTDSGGTVVFRKDGEDSIVRFIIG